MPRFTVDTAFEWQGQMWRVVRRIPHQQLNVEAIKTQEIQTISIKALQADLFNGKLSFAHRDRDNELESTDHRPIFEDYDPVLQAVAEYRKEVILPLLSMNPRTRKDVTARVKKIKKLIADKKMPIQHQKFSRKPRLSVSVMSVYRWIKFYEQSGYDLRALIPNSHKQGNKRSFADETERIIRDVIEDKALQRLIYTIDDIHDEIILRICEANIGQTKQLQKPSRSTIARRIEEMGLWERFAARRGTREAYYKQTQFGKIAVPDQPLSRVEIDHTKIDLIVVDDNTRAVLGRPTLTVCMDVTTRYILGYYLGFEPPSFQTVRECLYHAILPKGEDLQQRYDLEHRWEAYGLPMVIVIDNGKEFHSKAFEDSCYQLGIIIEDSPAYTPHFKAFVERQFRTLNTGVLKKLDGSTFSNPTEKGDYNSMKEAKITLSQLDQILHLFIVDVYAQKFHKGLNGVPAQRWQAFVEGGFTPRLPTSVHELSILLGATEERVIQSSGIELHTLRYNCPELSLLRARLKGEPAKIKYHPGDLSHIYAYDPKDKKYVKVPALATEYTKDLSLWKHKVIRNNVLNQQDKEDQLSRAKAKRKIEEVANADLANGKLKTRGKVARWQTAGANAQTIQQESDPPSQPNPARTHTIQLDFDPEELEAMGFSTIKDEKS